MINYKLVLRFENRVRGARLTQKIFDLALMRTEKVLGKIAKFKNRLNGEVILVLSGDAQIKKLNKTYRGKNEVTDVLSFSYFGEERFPQDDVVGEIVISVLTAKKQASEHGKTLQQELEFLFVHGLLHIFGYDHEQPGVRKKMFDLQDEIIGNESWRAIIE